MTIKELSDKIERYRYQNLGLIAMGFALAIFSNFITTRDCEHVWFALSFLIIGIFLIFAMPRIKGLRRK
jgi:hypothetical protein